MAAASLTLRRLPLHCMTRLLNTHDAPCTLAVLVTNPPWTRFAEGALPGFRGRLPVCVRALLAHEHPLAGRTQKYLDGKWVAVDGADRFRLTKTEAQVWLALYNRVMDADCRRKYQYHALNRAELLKTRAAFNGLGGGVGKGDGGERQVTP